MTSLAIWWVRRDLRLMDNPALTAALAHATAILPVFVLDPALLNSPGHRIAEKRLAFLYGGLRNLDASLRERGSQLVIRKGRPLDALSALAAETGASAIFAAEDYSPYARRRDALVGRYLPLILTGGSLVRPPQSVVKANGEPYTVFTPFKRAWWAQLPPANQELLREPARFHPAPFVASMDLPVAPASLHMVPSENEARATLRAFTQAAIYGYATGRNRLDGDRTSALSPYLRFGMLSARDAVVAAQVAMLDAPDEEARVSASAWLDELAWREFYAGILYHFPHVLQQDFRPEPNQPAWVNDAADFDAWREGHTGYPVVDAAMRQLADTGWMHNRARMITASFLIKDLRIDWRWGERWFMQRLIDGDPASNNGGWQWTAGTGASAAPYFRVFNPVIQSRRADPDGDFARAWIPELRRVPDRYVHEPWTMPGDIQRQARCRIGLDYPAPIVEHAAARAQALAAYRRRELA